MFAPFYFYKESAVDYVISFTLSSQISAGDGAKKILPQSIYFVPSLPSAFSSTICELYLVPP